MTDSRIPGHVEYPPHLLDRVLGRIAPFCTDGSPAFSLEQSREAAMGLLQEMQPVTGKELQLAGLVCATSLASLNCLGCSAQLDAAQTDPMLRIIRDALKLSAMSEKAQRQLDTLQRNRRRGHALPAASRVFDEAEFTKAMNQAREMVTFARARGEASRVERDLAAASVGNDTGPRRRTAEQAWAEDLLNLAAWAQQTQH